MKKGSIKIIIISVLISFIAFASVLRIRYNQAEQKSLEQLRNSQPIRVKGIGGNK